MPTITTEELFSDIKTKHGTITTQELLGDVAATMPTGGKVILPKQQPQQSKVMSEPISQEQLTNPNTQIFNMGGGDPAMVQALVKSLATPSNVGATVATMLPTPLNMTPWGRIGMAFLGGAGGEGYNQLREMNKPGSKTTLGEAYKKVVLSGAEQLAYQGGGETVNKGISFLRNLGKASRLEPGAKEAEILFEKYGTHIPPAQLSKSRIYDTLQGISESSLFGSKALSELTEDEIPAAIEGIMNDLQKVYRVKAGGVATAEMAALKTEKGLEKSYSIFQQGASKRYNTLDNALKNAGLKDAKIVDLRPLKAQFAKEWADTVAAGGVGSSAEGDTLMKGIMNWPDSVNFKVADNLRSRLMKVAKSTSRNADVAEGIANKANTILTDIMDKQVGNKLPPEIIPLWEEARAFYREGIAPFKTDVVAQVRKLFAEKPEQVVSALYKPGANTRIKIMQNLIGEKAVNGLNATFIQDLVTKAALPDGKISGKILQGEIQKFANKGTMDIILQSPEAARNLQSIAQSISLAQKQTGGGGGMLIQLTQGGAVVGALSTMTSSNKQIKHTALAALLAVTGLPRLLGYALSRPSLSRYIAAGLRTPIESANAVAIATRLGSELMKAKMEDESESEPLLSPEMQNIINQRANTNPFNFENGQQ